MFSIEDNINNNEEIQQGCITLEEVNSLVDEMINKINKEFKKEIRDEITRNQIIHFIKQNYGDSFNIEKVSTVLDESLNKFKKDCYYWLFILTHKKYSKERIYITI